MPADDGQRTLVHGDYRIDNMIFEKDGPKCLAVLDWELSTIGHPYADLASVIMQWQMPAGQRRARAGGGRPAPRLGCRRMRSSSRNIVNGAGWTGSTTLGFTCPSVFSAWRQSFRAC